jgi:hypothetical protein
MTTRSIAAGYAGALMLCRKKHPNRGDFSHMRSLAAAARCSAVGVGRGPKTLLGASRDTGYCSWRRGSAITELMAGLRRSRPHSTFAVSRLQRLAMQRDCVFTNRMQRRSFTLQFGLEPRIVAHSRGLRSDH